MVLKKICHILHNKGFLLDPDLCLTSGRWDLQTVSTLVMFVCTANITRHIHQIPVTFHVCLTWLGRNLGKVTSRLIFRTSGPPELRCQWKLTAHHQQNHQSHESREFGNIKVPWDAFTRKKGGRFAIHTNLCEFIEWAEIASKTPVWLIHVFYYVCPFASLSQNTGADSSFLTISYYAYCVTAHISFILMCTSRYSLELCVSGTVSE